MADEVKTVSLTLRETWLFTGRSIDDFLDFDPSSFLSSCMVSRYFPDVFSLYSVIFRPVAAWIASCTRSLGVTRIDVSFNVISSLEIGDSGFRTTLNPISHR